MTQTKVARFWVRVTIDGVQYNAAEREDLEAVGALTSWDTPSDAQEWVEANVDPAASPVIFADYGFDPPLFPEGSIGAVIKSVVPPSLQSCFYHPDGSNEWWDWQVDSVVGADTAALLAKTWRLADAIVDVDVAPIWKAAADQCLTYAFG